MHELYRIIAKHLTQLKFKLAQADIPDAPHLFIKKILLTSFMVSFGVFVLFLLPILKTFEISPVIVLVLFPVGFLLFFIYLLGYPDFKIRMREKAINTEIIFAVRFLIIEIESGVPIYNVLINVSKAYPEIGKYFKAIVDKINLGTSMEDALSDATELVPSNNLRKVFWQLLNSIRTGADIGTSLHATLNQIIREQKIEVEMYGRKLNPLAMFYMMIAVIMPSLGITMLIIFAVFMGLVLKLPFLLTIVGLLTFIQFMFYAVIKSSRPAVEL